MTKLYALGSVLVLSFAAACAPNPEDGYVPATTLGPQPPLTLASCNNPPLLAFVDSVAIQWAGDGFSGIVGPFEESSRDAARTTLRFTGHSGSLDDFSYEDWYFELHFTTPFAPVPGTVLQEGTDFEWTLIEGSRADHGPWVGDVTLTVQDANTLRLDGHICGRDGAVLVDQVRVQLR